MSQQNSTEITGFNDPVGIAITPNGAYAYVTNSKADTVSVINTATNTITATITGFSNPENVAVAPNSSYVYVTNTSGNSVTVISTSNAITSPTPSSAVSPTISPSPSPISPTASPSTSPTVPEFSTASTILMVVCVLIVTICAVESAYKVDPRLNLVPSRRQRSE